MKSKQPHARAASAGQEPAPATVAAASSRRRWLPLRPSDFGLRTLRSFRLAAVAAPFLLLGLVELGLRLAGWGYPTSFFLRVWHNGRAVLIENPKFSWRFFPPAVARPPQPLSIAAEKPPGALRIFLLGESAAMGDPEPAYGFGRQLERLLQARHPDRQIEVVNVAITAINSHVIREIARDCAGRAGDCWIIYAGNNEVVGPFGAGTVFGLQAPGLAWVRASLALKKTRVGQLLDRGLRPSGPARWGGMEMFLGQQVRRDDPRLNNVYHHFAKNLSAIIQSGKRSGAKVLVSTMAVDLKDSPPFASQHRPGLGAADQGRWDQCFARGRQAETQGRQVDALGAYDQAARIDSDYAELAFVRARCELAQDRASAARADAQLACDLDTLRFRADSRLNEIICQTAAARGVRLIDAEQELARLSRGGVPGEDLFYDHVHLNFRGNYVLAVLFVPEVERALFEKAQDGRRRAGESPPSPGSSFILQPSAFPLLAEAEVARRLGFTDFDRRRALEGMRMRLRQPPFVSQSNFQERDERLRKALAAPAVPPAELVPEYRAALALAPDDSMLRANFGRLLAAAGDGPGAAAQWKEFARLLPHELDGWFQLGYLEHSAGHPAEAARLFQEALVRKPDCAEALTGLGLALAAQGKAGEAVALYTQALQLQPADPLAHYDLANAFAAQGRRAEALAHYRAAVQSQPEFAEARYHLALELTRLGKIADAEAQFAEVVRLKPDLAGARYNYGVALAIAKRYAEAVRQFREILNRQPDNLAARSALERALQLEKARAP